MPSSLQLHRFRRLPRVADDIWQGGIVSFPTWVDRPGGTPYRPQGALWISLKSGRVNLGMPDDQSATQTAAIDALLELGLKPKLAGCRPGRIEVADEHTAGEIRTALGDPDLPVVVRPDLPAVSAALEDMAAAVGDATPGALSAPGVTVDALRGFAAAAERFYRAAPWRHLTNDDLIHVEAPAAGQGLGLTVVMGGGGDLFGLSFLSSTEQFERIAAGAPAEDAAHAGNWAVYFDPAWEIPAADLMLWERERLPLAGDHAYPFAARIDPDGGVRRPDAGLLAYFEGLLAALADTSEDEMDRGRWTRRVTTAEGEKPFTLALPISSATRADGSRAGRGTRPTSARSSASTSRSSGCSARANSRASTKRTRRCSASAASPSTSCPRRRRRRSSARKI